ncbi:CD225/dispanin family protein [Thermosynechococcus sp. QS41]|uniref:CD225/dispanin family protein n=1 Tax=Thermosynechococcus sp. QS41 TaxID=3074101 RepID=UPI0028F45280|nr:CD225/dispanin family protein [Thermosynechococcus sp. QS41]
MVPAILSTICCCLPFGIVAIIFAAQVNSRLAVGDRAGALEASNKAKLIYLDFGDCGIARWCPLCGTHGALNHG